MCVVCIDLFEMVCPNDSSSLNISIPVVMVTNSTGVSLKSMVGSGKGEFLSDIFVFFSVFFFKYVLLYQRVLRGEKKSYLSLDNVETL